MALKFKLHPVEQLMNPIKSESPCHVCGRPDGIRNFDAIACRACGAFFRRAMALSRNYACECENGLNTSYTEGILGCKGCRLKRCFQAGMKRELVRAVSLWSFHDQRGNGPAERKAKKKQMRESHQTHEEQPPLPICPNDEDLLNMQMLEELGRICERAQLIGHSSTPLPNEAWMCTLEELLKNQVNLLARHEEFSCIPTPRCDRKELVDSIAEKGLHDPSESVEGTEQYREFQAKSNFFLRDVLISISAARTMPFFGMLDPKDQALQIKSTAMIAPHLLLAFNSMEESQDAMVMPNGVNIFETFEAAKKFYGSDLLVRIARKVFINPMIIFAKLKLDKCESMLLMNLLLSTPTAASAGLSKQAQRILSLESEKYGKMLLRLQQHLYGEQAGALRYMESLQVMWNAIECSRLFRELLEYIDSVLHQGVFTRRYPQILLSFNHA